METNSTSNQNMNWILKYENYIVIEGNTCRVYLIPFISPPPSSLHLFTIQASSSLRWVIYFIQKILEGTPPTSIRYVGRGGTLRNFQQVWTRLMWFLWMEECVLLVRWMPYLFWQSVRRVLLWCTKYFNVIDQSKPYETNENVGHPLPQLGVLQFKKEMVKVSVKDMDGSQIRQNVE